MAVQKSKKGSPSKVAKKVEVETPVEQKKKPEQKRKSRHQYDRVTHQVFTPFFTGLDAHLVTCLAGNKVSAEDIHNAILSYDAKAYFSSVFEVKGRRAGKKSKKSGKRPLSTFMLFQNEMRPRVSAKLEKDLGRKPSQPEVVTQLGKVWNAMKEKPDGINRYKEMYEENKKKAEASKADGLADSDIDS